MTPTQPPKPKSLATRAGSAARACARDLSKRVTSPLGAAGLGIAACAACCAAPLALGALGLGSTAIGAGLLSMLEPALGTTLGVLVMGVAVGVVVRRRASSREQERVSTEGAACATDSSCGCSGTSSAIYTSGPAAPDEPIVCTAPIGEMNVQVYMDRYRAVFAHLVAREPFPGGFAWRFRAEPGLEAELRTLATLERSCCSFFTFDLKRDSEHLVWETRADERAAAVLEEYSRLPERLAAEARPGHDLRSVKEHAEHAGLKFSNE